MEFKETLHLDKTTNQKNKELEKPVLKNIAAFLNIKEEGKIYIGVSDKKKIKGIDEEIKKFHGDRDKYNLTIKHSSTLDWHN